MGTMAQTSDNDVAPREEEEKSSAEKLAERGEISEPDQYGQVHPVETPELIETSLKELKAELDSRSDAEAVKQAWLQAMERCPELVGEDHKLMFLRCEVFDVKLATKRLLKYWTKRLALFGEDKAFLPLTLDKALKDDGVALSMGLMRVTGRHDATGRGILLADPSQQDSSKYSPESFVRALWYVLHAALEEPETQRKGIVCLVSPRRSLFFNFDRTLVGMALESIRGRVPMRIGAMHMCNPPTVFAVVFPILQVFMGPVLRKRIHVHPGSPPHVVGVLGTFGIDKATAPEDVGGDLQVDHEAWLKERRAAGK